MIHYQGFSKRYGRVAAVIGLDLEIRAGETLALVGPNGSGKSTTLKAAVGLVRPSEGQVTVAGVNVATDGRTARTRIGYLPQRLSFADGFTARETLRLFARLRRVDTAEEAMLLKRVGLVEAADREVGGFSGGMRQRLGIAVALLGWSGVLVLDEPTAALDPTGALAVRDLIAEIRANGTTVLLSSHDLTEVAALADRMAVFDAGRLAALGSPGELGRALGIPGAGVEAIYRAATGGSQSPTTLLQGAA